MKKSLYIRNVDLETINKMKAYAALNNMTLSQYLTMLVDKEKPFEKGE